MSHMVLPLSLSLRAANLYVSMNEGLSFISSSVTITTVSCVSLCAVQVYICVSLSAFIYQDIHDIHSICQCTRFSSIIY